MSTDPNHEHAGMKTGPGRSTPLPPLSADEFLDLAWLADNMANPDPHIYAYHFRCSVEAAISHLVPLGVRHIDGSWKLVLDAEFRGKDGIDDWPILFTDSPELTTD